MNGIWALKPSYLGPWTLRAKEITVQRLLGFSKVFEGPSDVGPRGDLPQFDMCVPV